MFTKPVNAPSVSTSPLVKRVLVQEILKLHLEASSLAFVGPLFGASQKPDQICLQNNTPLPPINPSIAIIFRPARQMALFQCLSPSHNLCLLSAVLLLDICRYLPSKQWPKGTTFRKVASLIILAFHTKCEYFILTRVLLLCNSGVMQLYEFHNKLVIRLFNGTTRLPFFIIAMHESISKSC